jgi:hypothetical protein
MTGARENEEKLTSRKRNAGRPDGRFVVPCGFETGYAAFE